MNNIETILPLKRVAVYDILEQETWKDIFYDVDTGARGDINWKCLSLSETTYILKPSH